jgi:hypothetical protein
LLLYHGWADPNFSAQSTIDYYRKVVDTIGSAPQTADWLRLFLAPGMGHCGGGEGLNTFDMVSALERCRVGCCFSKHQQKAGSDAPVVSLPKSQSTTGREVSTRPRIFGA